MEERRGEMKVKKEEREGREGKRGAGERYGKGEKEGQTGINVGDEG